MRNFALNFSKKACNRAEDVVHYHIRKSALQSYKVGDTVTVTVVRGGKYEDVNVTLIEDKPAETKIELSTERQ